MKLYQKGLVIIDKYKISPDQTILVIRGNLKISKVVFYVPTQNRNIAPWKIHLSYSAAGYRKEYAKFSKLQ